MNIIGSQFETDFVYRRYQETRSFGGVMLRGCARVSLGIDEQRQKRIFYSEFEEYWYYRSIGANLYSVSAQSIALRNTN